MRVSDVLAQLARLAEKYGTSAECKIELCDKHFISDYREIYQIEWEPQEGVVALIPEEAKYEEPRGAHGNWSETPKWDALPRWHKEKNDND